jgi:octaprenyl-diphosphate synthase
MSTDKIKAPIAAEMAEFEKYFRKQLKTPIPLLDIITNYVLRQKGKQMRPMLVFLSAKLHPGYCDKAFVAATLIELLHTATLVHDDVVDETYQRRGFFSVNALWNSKISVLVGDYFLSKGLLTALDNNETEILKIVSKAVKAMSEGELQQIEKARKLDITEEEYYEIIGKKTASLISACTCSGAYSADASEEQIKAMTAFGENLGIAFQIRDDLFDYEKSGIIGKPTGNDIKEKKLTLPLIHVLDKSSPSKRREIISTIRRHHKNEKRIGEIISYVEENGGLEYTRDKMQYYSKKAAESLSIYPDSPYKQSLLQLIDYNILRKK